MVRYKKFVFPKTNMTKKCDQNRKREMDPITIFKAASIAKSIAAYLGVIDSVSADMKKLLHQSFKSALMNLKYAKDASNSTTCESYIKQAINEFIRAIAVEENENLVSAYLGLSMCQYKLGDFINAKTTLKKISSVNLSKTERAKVIVCDVSGYSDVLDYNIPNTTPLAMAWRGVNRTFGNKGVNELRRENALNLYKENAIKVLKEI